MNTRCTDRSTLLNELKEWLRERQANYVEHTSMNGDTESGFYDTDEFNFDLLCDEIDKFGAELRDKEQTTATNTHPQEEKS